MKIFLKKLASYDGSVYLKKALGARFQPYQITIKDNKDQPMQITIYSAEEKAFFDSIHAIQDAAVREQRHYTPEENEQLQNILESRVGRIEDQRHSRQLSMGIYNNLMKNVVYAKRMVDVDVEEPSLEEDARDSSGKLNQSWQYKGDSASNPLPTEGYEIKPFTVDVDGRQLVINSFSDQERSWLSSFNNANRSNYKAMLDRRYDSVSRQRIPEKLKGYLLENIDKVHIFIYGEGYDRNSTGSRLTPSTATPTGNGQQQDSIMDDRKKYAQGVSLFNVQKKPEEALKIFEDIATRNPSGGVFLYIGKCYLALGNKEKAKESFNNALGAKSNSDWDVAAFARAELAKLG